MRLWVWRNIALETPEDWEMLQYSRKTQAGNVAFADRYRFRLECSWQVLNSAPDLERMMSDYLSKLRTDLGDAGAVRITSGECPGVQSGRGEELTTRFARFLAGESCLLEMVFRWPTGRDKGLERSVVESVRAEPERAGLYRRWRAFGVDALVSKGLALDAVKVAPALAVMTFGGDKGGPRQERFERLGMTSNWMRGSVASWLVSQAPGELAPGSPESREMPGHQVEVVRGTMPGSGVGRLLGRRRHFRAAAWVCPVDGRLYHVQVASAEELGADDIDLAGGRLSCCRDMPLAT